MQSVLLWAVCLQQFARRSEIHVHIIRAVALPLGLTRRMRASRMHARSASVERAGEEHCCAIDHRAPFIQDVRYTTAHTACSNGARGNRAAMRPAFSARLACLPIVCGGCRQLHRIRPLWLLTTSRAEALLAPPTATCQLAAGCEAFACPLLAVTPRPPTPIADTQLCGLAFSTTQDGLSHRTES